MRLIGERRAVAAAILAYFGILFGTAAYVGPPQLIPMFAGMGVAYGVAFIGVVALWFWARWFAIGLGFSGVVLAIIAVSLIPVAVPRPLWNQANAADSSRLWKLPLFLAIIAVLMSAVSLFYYFRIAAAMCLLSSISSRSISRGGT